MSASACIGRVGGLAVALGVGAAVATGAVGVASADPAASAQDSASDADRAARRPAARMPAGAATRTAPRSRERTAARSTRPAPAAGKRNDNAAPSSAGPDVAPNSKLPLTSGAAVPDVVKVPTAAEPVRSLAPPAPAMTTPTASPLTLTVTPPPAARVPAVATAVYAVRSPFTRTAGPGAPVEATVGWVVLAAARRGGRPLPATAVAATVGTGQTLDPTAASTAEATGSNPITTLLFNQTPTQSGSQTGQGPTGVVTGAIEVTDPDSDAFTFAVATAPARGSVQINSVGQFAYTPDPVAARVGFTDTFTVTVSDAASGFHIHGIGGLLNLLTFGLLGTSGHTDTHTVTVTVAPVNSAPTATVTVGEPDPGTGVVLGAVAGADADRDTLSYTGSTTTAKGAVLVAADGSFTYTPTAAARHAAAALDAAVADTTDSFAVTVADGYGGAVIVSVGVAIAPANIAPVAVAGAGDPDPESGVVAGQVSATDADGDTVEFSAPAETAKGTLVLGGDGSFLYTPTATARHTAASLSASAADRTDTITVTVTDGHGGATPVSVSVTIVPANSAPTATVTVGDPDPDTGVVLGAVAAADADGDTLSYIGATTAKGTLLVAADGSFTYTPTGAARHAAASPLATPDETTDIVAITVDDGHGGSLDLPVTVAIAPDNSVPTGSVTVGIPDPATGLVTGAVLGADADGDPLTFTGSATTAKGTVLVGADGGFSYTPTPAARHVAAAVDATAEDTTDTFTVTIADGYGGTAAVAVTVPIAPANNDPVAVADVGLPDASTGVVTGSVNAYDPDGDPLAYGGPAGTAKGSVVIDSDGVFAYTPTPDARHAAASLNATAADTADTFTITVSDGHGGTVAVPVSVTIAPANADPVATAVAGLPDATTGLVAGAILGVDADGDALSYNGSQTTTKGTVVVADDGGFTYSPTALARHLAAAANATVADTTDTFIVTVADGYGGTVAVPVTVTVSPAAVTFAFTYGTGSQYWTATSRDALESAAARLSSYLVVDEPVTVTYDIVGENNPGTGWLATAWVKFSSGSPGYYGTVVQNKIITGVDANGSTADGQLTVNFAYPWAFGDTVPNNRYDFQSVAMHELVHTLGFITGYGTDLGVTDRNWTTYDSFLAGADGTSPIGGSYVWNSAFIPNLTGGNGGLYFAGPNAVSAYGGPVPLYTPGTWTPGSSLTHLDPADAPPATVYLMDPSDSYGPGVRVFTGVEVGILTDLGYTIHAFAFVGFGLLRRRRQPPISDRHCARSDTR